MINSINYENLERCFSQTDENVYLFAPIFNRKSGKTTRLLKLAEKHNGIYVGASAELCKVAKKNRSEVKALSPTQILNNDGLFDKDDVFIVDEVKEKEIKRLQQTFPHNRIFGLVEWEKSPNWRVLYFTETLLSKQSGEVSDKNRDLLDGFYNDKTKAKGVLETISNFVGE